MMERMEKAYYLKEEELAVLLAFKHVRQLYGFRMEAAVGMDRETLNRIMFGMAKKEILTIAHGGIQIDAGMEAVLDDMAGARNVLTLTGRPEYPECCIYAGQNLVFVQTLGQEGKRYRMEPVERQEACPKMREYGWVVPGVLDRARAGQEDEKQNRQLQELAGRLYGQEKERILREREVGCCLIQYAVPQIRKIRQLLLINDGLEDYLTVSDGETDAVYLYSDEKSEELLLEATGGGL